MKILSNTCISGIFILSSAFCSDVFINQNCINIKNPAILFCICKNTGSFIDSALDWVIFNIPKEYNIPSGFHTYITTTDLDSIPKQLPTWYTIIGYCRSFFILNESYYSLLKDIQYKKLPKVISWKY